MSTGAAPNRTVMLSMLDRPNTRNYGSTATAMSSSREPDSSSATVPLRFALEDAVPMFEFTLGDLANLVGLRYPPRPS